MPSVSLPGVPSVLDLGLAGSWGGGSPSQRAPLTHTCTKGPSHTGLLSSGSWPLTPLPLTSALSAPRRCASCRTERTPLWRDAEDGTPLCNACGIRSSKGRRDWGWGPHLSPRLASMGHWENTHLWECTSLVAVSGLSLPAECLFLAPPSQVQEIRHPLLQLLAGAQEKCAAQEAMWQMWGVPGPPPSLSSGRVSPSSPSQACPASASPGGK